MRNVLYALLLIASPAWATITLTDMTDNRVYSRSGSSASMTVAGTYSGTPTSIEARVVDDGTSTEVVTWSVVDAAPSGGTFSGTLSVPEGGPYNMEVRFSNDTMDTDAGTAGWFVGANVLVIGDNTDFETGTLSGCTPESNTRKYDGGSWGTTATSYGNGACGLANQLAIQSSVPVGVAFYSVASSAMHSDAEGGSGYWADTAASSIYDTAQTAANAIGVEAVVLFAGKTDARSGLVTEGEAETALNALRSNVTSDIGAVPMVIVELGRGTNASDTDASWEAVRKGMQDVVDLTDDIYGVVSIDLDLATDACCSTADYKVIGERIGQAISYALGDVLYYRGPVISWAREINSTTVDVRISHGGAPQINTVTTSGMTATINVVYQGGIDFTPTSGITGFEIFEDGSPLSVTAAAQLRFDTIRLTLGSAVTGTLTGRYLYGAAPTVTGAVVDDGALTLPLRPEESITFRPLPYVEESIIDINGSPRANLSGLRLACWDNPAGTSMTSPSDQTKTAQTNASGLLRQVLTNTTKTVGEQVRCWLSNTDESLSIGFTTTLVE